MPSKSASDLNRAQQEKEIEENLKSQINGIKALIEQNISAHIPKGKQEEIEILGINYDDYIPLGEVDYKGLNCIVHYQRKKGDKQVADEHMVFSLDENGMVTEALAKVDKEGLIELTPDFRERLQNAQNAELVQEQDGKSYLTREDGKLKTISEEERAKQLSSEEKEKEEIAQSYRQMRGKEDDDEILSITEIEDPNTFAKVLEIPLEDVSGKYKLVRFKNDIFILVDDKNQIKVGIEVSELARDIHDSLEMRPEDKDNEIKAEDLDVASTVPGRYNIVKVRNREMDDTEIMISYSTTADSEVHLFERDEKGDLTPVSTKQKYPPKIIENGQENNILPAGVTDLAKLKERQEKLEKALELQRTIEAYEGKTHIVEALAGASTGAIKGLAVGTITTGNAELGAVIGAGTGAIKEYKASKASAEETIKECEAQRDELFAELDIISIEEAELEQEETSRYLGDSLDRYGY